jgi:pyruvate, water dikinase
VENLVWFEDLEKDLLRLGGGKGASLCKMYNNGLPVPNGFIICAPMFLEFMNRHNLFDKILSLIEEIDFDNSAAIDKASEEIQKHIIDSPFPRDMEENILRYYKNLGERSVPVAVRSSSTAEDLDDASFAGQQETYLYVIGEEDLIEKIKKCWASLYNGRAIFYRKEKGFDEKSISIAVVVQKMVNSEKSGVMFTVNPITKVFEDVIIEAAWGLGEGIVSGIVTPDSYIVNKNTKELLEEYISEKEVMVIRDKSLKGVEELEVPEDKRCERVLEQWEIHELVDLANRLEAYFEKPQDVEWAVEKGKVYLLQSRPITTL